MNKYFHVGWNILLTVFVCILFILHFFSDKKDVVFINSDKLFNEYQGMIEARNEYQSKLAFWQSNTDTLTNEIQTKIVEYERKTTSLSTTEKNNLRDIIRSKQQQLAHYQQAIKEKAQEEDARMTDKVLKKANAFLQKYGKEQGYKIIFASSSGGSIVYGEEYLDITDKVIKALNEEYRADNTSPNSENISRTDSLKK